VFCPFDTVAGTFKDTGASTEGCAGFAFCDLRLAESWREARPRRPSAVMPVKSRRGMIAAPVFPF